jgi:hypothetical protein
MARSIFAVTVTPASVDSAWTFTVTAVLSERQVLRSRHGEFVPKDRLVFYAPVPFTQFFADWQSSPLAAHLQHLRQNFTDLTDFQATKVYAIFSQKATPPIVWLTQPDVQRLHAAGWIAAFTPLCWGAGFFLQRVPAHRLTPQHTAQAPASPSRFGLRAIPWLSVLAQATRELPSAQAQELTTRVTAQMCFVKCFWLFRTFGVSGDST